MAPDDKKRRSLSLVPADGAQTLMPPAPPGKPPVICRDLTKFRNIGKEMARIYRAVRRGQLDSKEGARLVYILGQLGDIIEREEIVRRLEQLERTHGDR